MNSTFQSHLPAGHAAVRSRLMGKFPMIIYSAAIVLAMVQWPVSAAAQDPKDILIVANPSFHDTAITVDHTREIFLDKRRNLPSGAKVIPINAPAGSAVRNDFRARVLKMSAEDEKTYWKDQKIKMGNNSPPEFKQTQKAAFKIRKGVSYVYRSDFKQGVSKVLLVVPSGLGD